MLRIAVTTCVVFVTESYFCKLDEDSLSNDLTALETLYDVSNIIDTPVQPGDVELYYEQTTNRDYWLLQLFNGPGMHSTLSLSPPIGQVCGTSLQAVMILDKICTNQCKRVMKVGCGQGFCSLFLAKICPGIRFTGIDILATHIKIAQSHQKESGLYQNAEFKVCDATTLKAPGDGGKYDLIFAVEALCHLDTPHKRNAFLTQAYNCLSEEGIVVIIDGFRSDTFEMCSHNQRSAMQLAEKGFRINAMPAKGVETTRSRPKLHCDGRRGFDSARHTILAKGVACGAFHFELRIYYQKNCGLLPVRKTVSGEFSLDCDGGTCFPK